jgi:soluble lytic murein transglycosylase-like protein/tetratricopeptide (TPR) repeat protein
MMLLVFVNLHAALPVFDTIDTTGCEALRQGNYKKALNTVRSQKKVVDWAFWYFKKGMANSKLGNYSEAYYCFNYCTQHDSVLAPIAWEYLGDAATFAMRPLSAAQAYLNAQKDSLSREHYSGIVIKLKSLVRRYPLLTDSLPVLRRWKVDTALKAVTVSPFFLLDSVMANPATRAQTIDSCIGLFSDTSATVNAHALLDHIDSLHIPDTVISSPHLFRLSQLALQCKKTEMADVLFSKARIRPDFIKAIPEKTALLHEGNLAYQLKRYAESAKILTNFITKYSMQPDVVFTIARSYRNLNADTNAGYWYRQYIQYFPSAQAATGVYWYLAWDYEQNGIYDTAISYYNKNGATDKKGVISEAALYRIGLCHYKSGNVQAAYSTFSQFLALYSDASQRMGAQYWRGMSLLSMHDTLEAKNNLRTVAVLLPTDFYAYRARTMLLALGDTLLFPAFDTTRSTEAIVSWLDSAGSSHAEDTLTQRDTAKYYAGVKLLLCGLPQVAGSYLEPLELAYAGNLGFQFDMSVMYTAAGRPAESFRVARRLAQRIPIPCRAGAPLYLYNLTYPLYYYDMIKKTATADSIDPFLVLGVMRQESVFNAGIFSKAGAVGLLQLMPETAKTVAKSLSERFSAESLKVPATNIRYGSHYLRNLLMQCNGDLITAIAGYNAGPIKAKRWQEKNQGKPFDLLVEDVGFDETRNYVKKVLANYWTYSALSRFNRTLQ